MTRPPDRGTWMHDCDELPTAHWNTTQPTLDANCTLFVRPAGNHPIPLRLVDCHVTLYLVSTGIDIVAFPPPKTWYGTGPMDGEQGQLVLYEVIANKDQRRHNERRPTEFRSESIDVICKAFTSAVHGDRPLHYNDEAIATRSGRVPEYSTVSEFVSTLLLLLLYFILIYTFLLIIVGPTSHEIKR